MSSDSLSAKNPRRTAPGSPAGPPGAQADRSGPRGASPPPAPWPVRLAVAAAALLAGATYLQGLTGRPTNFYYSAAARSMAADWGNFFFGAYDPEGFITIDKPPGGIWPQALAVKLFGHHTWSLLLPQAVAGVLTVFVLFAVVRRWAGNRAGVLASFVLALTPAVAAGTRSNIPDAFLLLLLVGAAYTTWRAMEDGRWRWIVATGLLVGAAFHVKLVMAYVALPALAAVYLVAGREPIGRRAGRVLAAGAATVAASAPWALAVALTPLADRPYVDGSTDGSVWQMIFEYNLSGRSGESGHGTDTGAANAMTPFSDAQPPPIYEGGPSGWDRLFDDQIAGQITWLLPLALVLLAAGLAACGRRPRADRERAGWILWGGWLLVYGAAISFAAGAHPYYTMTMAPAVAAIVGAGLDGATRAGSSAVLRRALPIGVLLSAGWTIALLGRTPDHRSWLRPAVAAAVVAAVTFLLLARRRPRPAAVAAVCAAAALLLAPAAWIADTFPKPDPMVAFYQGIDPVAGPQPERPTGEPPSNGVDPDQPLMPGPRTEGMLRSLPPMPAPFQLWGMPTYPDPKLVAFLRQNRHGERFHVAVTGATGAAPYLHAGLDVMPMGGMAGTAPAPTASGLAESARSEEVRYVLFGGFNYQSPTGRARTAWVRGHCAKVSPLAYASTLRMAFTSALFDCRPGGTATPTAGKP